jgi:DNA uptake protein ComE-like DNA-binding protein
MKRIIRYLREELDFSIEEAKSAFWFVIFLLILVISYNLYSLLSLKEQSTIVIEENKWESLPEQKEFENKYNYKFENSNFSKNTYSNKPKFLFDPNKASESDFNKMGFPKYIANSIINYRNKGGKYKYKEDLLKIYVMKANIYEEFEPYISLPSKFNNKSDFEENTKLFDLSEPKSITNINTPFEKNNKPDSYSKKSIKLSKFDINTADTTQLKLLKGVGSGYASRIIKYRELLGGFANIDQVGKTYNLPPEVLEEIKKWAYIGSSVKKIKINEVDIIKHPMIKYNQAKAIIAFRKEHGKFTGADDLAKVKALDQETIQAFLPYVDF